MTVKKKASDTQFLNVDLDVYSGSDLQPLVDAFGKKVIVLYVGRERRAYSAHLELPFSPNASVDSTIRGLCDVIETLPKASRKLWSGARAREFSVGVQAGQTPLACDFRIESQTLQRVARLGAMIVLTVYAPEIVIRRKVRTRPKDQR